MSNLFASLDLVRRIEAAETRLITSVVNAVGGNGETVLVADVAGGSIAASREGSPFNKLVGAGFGQLDEEAPVAAESRALALSGTVRAEIATLADPALVRALIVAPAYSSADLKSALETGKKIVITTIQKFPFIVDGIADLSDKRFPVIIDEAHSSLSGTAAGKMNQAMGNTFDETEEEEDTQDTILEVMRSKKMRGNASYLAFTATPKNNTLERFSEKQADGKYKPFYLYSMKQAIEEGFILDVLANYTTYRSYYEIEKSIQENPLFDTVKARPASFPGCAPSGATDVSGEVPSLP